MGDYSYDDHVELFGGPPEPGEGVDWREWVDLERKARKEDPPPPAPAPRRPWWRWWRRGA